MISNIDFDFALSFQCHNPKCPESHEMSEQYLLVTCLSFANRAELG